jgi:hypothetical protein
MDERRQGNGIARVKETKRGEKAARRRSALIVPRRRGNLNRGDPAEGRGSVGSENCRWVTREVRWNRMTCQRNSDG